MAEERTPSAWTQLSAIERRRTLPDRERASVRDVVDLATAVSPGVRVVTRAFLVLTASVATAVTIAAVLDQRARLGATPKGGPSKRPQ
jgi:hypothetical protein